MMDYHKWSQQYQERGPGAYPGLEKEAADNSTDHNWNGMTGTPYNSTYLECKHTAELLGSMPSGMAAKPGARREVCK